MKNERSHPSFYGFTITDAAARSGLPYVTVWSHFMKLRVIALKLPFVIIVFWVSPSHLSGPTYRLQPLPALPPNPKR